MCIAKTCGSEEEADREKIESERCHNLHLCEQGVKSTRGSLDRPLFATNVGFPVGNDLSLSGIFYP